MNEAKSQHPRSGYSLRERGACRERKACSFLGLFYITLHLFTTSHWHAHPPWGGEWRWGLGIPGDLPQRWKHSENFASFT